MSLQLVKAFAAALLLHASTMLCAAGNPLLDLAHTPLRNGRGNVHSNLLLSLSADFSMARLAYRGDHETYDRNHDYVGYFNSAKCYAYNGGNRNLRESGTLAELGYFHIASDADVMHECDGSTFSGNFLNWAASSMIDIVRYALTGGDRVYDDDKTTILQRTVLKDVGTPNFYAHETYFPRRTLKEGGKSSAPHRVTPFKNIHTLYVVSCRNRLLFSDQRSENVEDGHAWCMSAYDGANEVPRNAIDKKLGEYLARVKVCDSHEGSSRSDLCHKYANAYKPVGELQRNADKIRFGVMGYLLDDDKRRYGGVLRAPMKHIGEQSIIVPNFTRMVNDRPEWDPATGVVYSHPDEPTDRNNSGKNSGMANYLNKFGRSGKYKTHDPLSELYYEGIRYFQGKGPTPEATAKITEGMKDEFPVIESWVDPIMSSCQRNYILSLADASTHYDRYVPGNSRIQIGSEDAFDNERVPEGKDATRLDVRTWTERIGKMEADENGDYRNSAANKKLANLHLADTGADGHGAYYMSGLAYWANTHDLRGDKPTRVKTFVIDVDETGDVDIDSSRRAVKPRDSQLYLAAKYGGFNDSNGDGNPFVTAAIDGETLIDGTELEWGNGKGNPTNYFLAGQPKELIKAIRTVFRRVGATGYSGSDLAAWSGRVASDGAFVYRAGTDVSGLNGQFKKIEIVRDVKGELALADAAEWDAAKILTGLPNTKKAAETPAVPEPEARRIYTMAFDERDAPATVEFRWSRLDSIQKAALDISPETGSHDGLGERRLEYLRGDRNLELHSSGKQRIFRTRVSILGDIGNSNPVYVGPPAANVHGPAYQEFLDKNRGRMRAVYVGANDGMLHAFSAVDGKELFAYVPRALIPQLNQLTDIDFVHRPYADGMISVGDAMVRGKWKTILASGMAAAAQGVFTLDITDPSSFGSGLGSIFEFTDADDPDMGNLFGPPLIAKFRVASGKDGSPEYRYFIVVPSGVNNYKDDGDKKFNNDAAGALFLLSLDKPAGEKWKLGENYYKFRTPSQDATHYAGLSAPALVADGDGAVRRVYAGDLQGNLWRFDFNGTAPWNDALSGTTPLFVAKAPVASTDSETADAKTIRQPITVQPKVLFAPGGGYVVLFGTGKLLEHADTAPGNFRAQSFYAVYDAAKMITEGSEKQSHIQRTELMPRTLAKTADEAFTIEGKPFSYGEGARSIKGWYFDFFDSAITGERSVTDPVVADGTLFLNTFLPGTDPCVEASGRTYVLNGLTGLPPGGVATGKKSEIGMLSSPVKFGAVAEVGQRNALGRREVRKTYSVVNFGTAGAEPAQKVEATLPAGRFSWREILNWQELRNAIGKKK
ncbi:MAG: pilus assembly protein PilY [Noviherbaspirillum sp.]|nr:pilus assembly protein PilY [Noviherbaspirillum sp.]